MIFYLGQCGFSGNQFIIILYTNEIRFIRP